MKVWKTFLLCALVNFCSGFYDNEEEQPGMLSIPLRRVLSPDERVESSGMAQESKIDVEMANIINYLYYGTVYVGEKRQGFRVVFDTGSDWFWVQDATRCPPKQCKAKSKFWCDSKKNCKFLGYNKTMGYLDGTKVEGQVFQDNIYLTSSSKGVGASYHGINAFRVSDPTNSPIDGLMGVGLRSEANVLQALKTAGVINDRIFTIYFYDNPYANGNVDSMVTFGGYNPSYIQGNYTYSPLVSTDTWTIEMKEFLVGDQKIALTNTKALIDTGTSYVIMPLEEFTLFTQIIKTTVSSACDFSNKEYTCPSMALTKFPTLKVKFGTQEFILEPKNYVRTEFGRLRIMVGQPTYGSRRWIIGCVFLKKYSAIFDMENQRIGFALSKVKVPTKLWVKIVGIVLFAAISICILVMAYKYIKRRKEERNTLLSFQLSDPISIGGDENNRDHWRRQ